MAKTAKKIQIMMVFILIASLLAPMMGLGVASFAGPARMAEIQPALAEVAAASPDELVRVIVQKAGGGDQAERFVEQLDGIVLKDLAMINAFAAQLPGQAVKQLAGLDAVSRIALDAPVVNMGKPTTTAAYDLLDNFAVVSYSNNDGFANWSTNWLEEDANGQGSSAGFVWVTPDIYTKCDETGCYAGWDQGELRLTGDPSMLTQSSIARQADLSDGVTSATLSYTFSIGPGADRYEDVVVLEVSTDSGVSYTFLSDFTSEGEITGSSFRNILAYASAQTRFRFRVQSGFDGPDEYFAVDNFKIEYEGNALPNYTYLDTLNVRSVWELGYTGAGIGVAVVDSGISNDQELNVAARTTFNPNSNTVNDVYGHGTHVAGIIGMDGSSSGGHYLGIAPDVDLISLKISDENGMAYESDTVDAMEWILDNKETHNIRVVNLSIQSAVEQPYNESALNAAAEILWFNGIVVVAAAGNWDNDYLNPIYTAPANDPFLITVGATTEKGTTKLNDDAIASYSANGETQDFFLKPEIYAPGTDIISVLSKDSSWDLEHPDRSVFGGQYFRISGTSMAAPMVSGAAALLLQAEPNLTPDQVKYRLMTASGRISNQPYLDIYQAITTPTTESANQDIIPHQLLAQMAMIAYWANAEGEENVDWENVDWAAVNWNAVNWNAVNWNAVNWNAVNWNAVNWNAVNWNAVNWNAVNWNAVNWNAVNWNAVNWNAVNWNAVNWNAMYWGEE